MTDFEAHLRRSIEEVNRLQQSNGSGSQDRTVPHSGPGLPDMPVAGMPPRPAYDFVTLNDKVAASMMEIIEQQVTMVENLKAEAQALAQKMQANLAAMDDRIFNTNAKLKVLGGAILAAYNKFHESDEQG